jgi:hypothetical protein
MGTIVRLEQLASQLALFLASGHVFAEEIKPTTQEFLTIYAPLAPSINSALRGRSSCLIDPIAGLYPIE